MTEVKTLKDLREGRAERGVLGACAAGMFVEAQYMAEDNLKQEAVKWIKEMRENPTQKLADLFGINIDFHEQEFEIIEKWIKYFFNITEEELGECKHDWGNILLMSNPPQRRCIKCGKTEFLNNLCSSTSGDFK